MNPLARLYGRSRAFRVICYFLMLVAIVLVWVVSDDMWSNYTQVGDLTLFFSFLVLRRLGVVVRRGPRPAPDRKDPARQRRRAVQR
jgi:hypothetical protein